VLKGGDLNEVPGGAWTVNLRLFAAAVPTFLISITTKSFCSAGILEICILGTNNADMIKLISAETVAAAPAMIATIIGTPTFPIYHIQNLAYLVHG
jgi:hypothetical protein